MNNFKEVITKKRIVIVIVVIIIAMIITGIVLYDTNISNSNVTDVFETLESEIKNSNKTEASK